MFQAAVDERVVVGNGEQSKIGGDRVESSANWRESRAASVELVSVADP